MIVFFVLVISVCMICISNLWIRINARSKLNLPPGPRLSLPYFGTMLSMLKYDAEKLYDSFDKMEADYGPIIYVKFGKVSQVTIQELELAKELLNSDVWVDRYFDEIISERSFGKPLGIIFSFGDSWKIARKFTMKNLRDFGFGKRMSMESVLEEEISTLTRTMDEYASTGAVLSMHHLFNLSVLNVLWSMVAGIRFSHDDIRLRRMIQLVDEASKLTPLKIEIIEALPHLYYFAKYLPKYRKLRTFYKNFHCFIQEMLEERRMKGTYNKEPNDFIDVFLSEIDHHKEQGTHPNHFTDEQFTMVVFDLFVAGADTTSNTLEFAFLYMLLNPRVQTKVHSEIDKVLGTSRSLALSDKSKMPYVEATLLEIQRCANVLPLTFRGAARDTTLAGYNIPKGTVAGVNLTSIHKSKAIWSDPETFRPERFLDSNNNVINAHKILPFGLGKRVCLGEALARASLFSYFTSLMQRYTFTASPKHPQPNKEPVYGFTLSAQEYYVTLKHR